MPDFTVAIGLLKKPIEDVYSLTTGAAKQKIALVRATKKVKELHTRLWQIQRVKTIWNPDRAMSLGSIFHPVDVRVIGEDYESVRSVHGVDDLIHRRCIVYGTAGQGKSILLKYLVGREIKSGKRIPLLCELRDIGQNPLEDSLVASFSLLLGISPDPDVFHAFAAAGKISFLLDGFDEIESSRVQSVLREIEVLSFKYPDSKILLTSRPEAECRSLAGFGAAYVKPLAAGDLAPFFRKITKDGAFSAKIVAAIEASPVGIRSLVTTPLLATLLVISYRAAHKIPLEFSDFYEELFQVLLVRHDAAKLGWRRERKSGLTDRQIQQVFEAFCFAVRRQKAVAVQVDKALDLIESSSASLKFKVDPQAYFNDIKKITCLVLQEGRKVEFVHASVAHYFAARYIRLRPESVASNFYSQLLNGKWASWVEELRFLRQIDSHRFYKHFLIPDILRTLAYFDAGAGLSERFTVYLKSLLIAKIPGPGDDYSYLVRVGKVLDTYSENSFVGEIFRQIFVASGGASKPWIYSFESNPSDDVRSYYDIAVDCGGDVLSKLFSLASKNVARLRNDLAISSAEVEHAEAITDFVTI